MEACNSFEYDSFSNDTCAKKVRKSRFRLSRVKKVFNRMRTIILSKLIKPSIVKSNNMADIQIESSNERLDNEFDSISSRSSSFSFASVLDSSNEIDIPRNSSSRQIFAASIADLNLLFAHQGNESKCIMPGEAKKFFDQIETPQQWASRDISFECGE